MAICVCMYICMCAWCYLEGVRAYTSRKVRPIRALEPLFLKWKHSTVWQLEIHTKCRKSLICTPHSSSSRLTALLLSEYRASESSMHCFWNALSHFPMMKTGVQLKTCLPSLWRHWASSEHRKTRFLVLGWPGNNFVTLDQAFGLLSL